MAKKDQLMATRLPGVTIAPGTDIVLPVDDEVLDVLFDRTTRKLIASLHRRFWEKRRNMLQARAIDRSTLTLAPTSTIHDADSQIFGEVVCDLRATRDSWDGRLEQYSRLREALVTAGLDSSPFVVRVRGWEETDPGVLVDGRAVPSCIVDVAVALRQSAQLFRQDVNAVVLDTPEAVDAGEVALWADLMCLAQDRSGIDRDTVSYGVLRAVARSEPEIAVA